MSSKIKIGTRKSDLALTQTGTVVKKLSEFSYAPEVHHIVTTGDKDLRPFENLAGDGYFTKEIERQLLHKKIDLAVHSSKDLPSLTHQDLPWMAFGDRESTQDVLIIKKENLLNQNPLKIKSGLRLGTSSPRRNYQIQKLFPDSQIVSIRGNVPTRINKVLKNEVDATILALAGVHRLQLEKEILSQGLSIIELPFITAPCQGILGVQAHRIHLALLKQIANKELTDIARAEKILLAMLGGGCQLAVGGKIQKKNSLYNLDFYYHNTKQETALQISAANTSELLRCLFQKLLGNTSNNGRVILTQSIQNLLSSAQKIYASGWGVVPWSPLEILPTWDINEFETLHNKFTEYDAFIFTSQFSVRIFMNEFISLYPEHLDSLKRKKIYCVGAATRSELGNYGISNVLQPTQAYGESLLSELRAQNPLFLGSKDAIFLRLLQKNGRNYKFLELYGSFNCSGPLSDLPDLKDNDKVLLTSPKLAKNFIESTSRSASKTKVQIYAFGPSTSKVLLDAGLSHQVNPEPGRWETLIELMKE